MNLISSGSVSYNTTTSLYVIHGFKVIFEFHVNNLLAVWHASLYEVVTFLRINYKRTDTHVSTLIIECETKS